MTTMKPGAKDCERALKIKPLFYDAVLSPDRWRIALKAVVDWFPGSKGAAFYLFHAPEYDIQYFHANYGFTEEETTHYINFEDRIDGDPRLLAQL